MKTNPSKDFPRHLCRLLPVAAGVLLGGCASESEMVKAARDRSASAIEELEHRSPCCETLSGLRYEMLSPNRTSATFPSAGARVRQFPTGRSYFMAVEVPKNQGTVVVNVRSEMLDGGRGSIPTVFAPSVVVLDRDFGEVAEPKELGLCFRRGWSKSGVGYFSSLEVDASRVRYLVFFTDRSKLQGSIPYDSSATTAGLEFVVAARASYAFPRSPAGRLDAWIENAADSVGELPAQCRSR